VLRLVLADAASPGASFIYEGITKSVIPALLLWAYILGEGENTPSPLHPVGCGLGVLIWAALSIVTTPLHLLAYLAVCNRNLLSERGIMTCGAVIPWVVPLPVCLVAGFIFRRVTRSRASRASPPDQQ
jgi:hypothetical protein